MTVSLLVAGPGFCGKTLLAYGLLRKFGEEGLRVTYFKPVSVAKRTAPSGKPVDADVLAIKDALGLEEDEETIAPVVLTGRYLELRDRAEELRKRIVEAYERVSKGKDVVVVEGYHFPEALTSIGCSVPHVAKMLGSKVVLIVGCKEELIVDRLVDSVALYKCFMEAHGVSVSGVIFNYVPFHHLERVKGVVAPAVEGLGLRVLGVVPEKVGLLAPTVRDVAEALGAEVLEGEARLDNLVEDILVGAMSPEASIKWIRRSANAAIVTGGDRTDLILQALEVRPSVVILTGNLYPAVRVLSRARELGVPVLLVPYDTYTTIEKLREAQQVVTAESLKIKDGAVMEVIELHVRWRELLNDLRR